MGATIGFAFLSENHAYDDKVRWGLVRCLAFSSIYIGSVYRFLSERLNVCGRNVSLICISPLINLSSFFTFPKLAHFAAVVPVLKLGEDTSGPLKKSLESGMKLFTKMPDVSLLMEMRSNIIYSRCDPHTRY